MEFFEYSNIEGEYDDIYDFFKIIDSYYYPPLSQRSDLTEFIDPIIKGGNIIYIKEDNIIIGMITYYYFYSDLQAAYIDSISVLKEHRGKKLGNLLIEKCFADLKLKNINLVKLRTWSTNEITTKFYPKLGFKIFKVVKDDRGPGVDSIYYEKEI